MRKILGAIHFDLLRWPLASAALIAALAPLCAPGIALAQNPQCEKADAANFAVLGQFPCACSRVLIATALPLTADAQEGPAGNHEGQHGHGHDYWHGDFY